MVYSLKITPAAFNDLQHEVEYYNNKQYGLGKRFAVIVSEAFDTIKTMPASCSFAYDTVRYKVILKFPYIILYEVHGDNIAVLRIFNTHQQPFWTK